MKNIPEVIKNMSFSNRGVNLLRLNRGLSDKCVIEIVYPETRYSSTDEIIDSNPSFVNGFKLVKTAIVHKLYDHDFKDKNATAEYAYIDEKTGEILPYRFNFATDFDEYGFALVFKDGGFNIIDEHFRHFEFYKGMEDGRITFPCDYVSRFSDSKYPIAKLYGMGEDQTVCYLNASGKVVKFVDPIRGLKASNFTSGSDFNANGLALLGNAVLFDSGYFCSMEDFLERLAWDKTLADVKDSLETRSKTKVKNPNNN